MQFTRYHQLMDPTGNRFYADLFDELKEQTALCEEAGFTEGRVSRSRLPQWAQSGVLMRFMGRGGSSPNFGCPRVCEDGHRCHLIYPG